MDPEEKAKILNGVKSMLRAVLQSSKEGVVAARLPGEYRGITGDPLPFKRLGYCTAEEFLRTLPDVVSARHNRDGELTYFAVADDSTAHIQRMVSAQRSNKSKKKGKGYRGKHLKVNVQSRRPVPSPYRKTGGGRFGPKIQRYSPPKMTLSRTSMIPHHTKQMAPARNSSSFEVPPRFQKTSSNMASSVPAAKSASSSSLKVTVPNTKNDKVFVNYKSALYEYAAKTKKSVYYNKTDSTKVGFVSSLCLEGVVYGSEDGYKSMKEAEQAAAMNACHALGIKVAGSPSPPRVVSVSGTEGKSAVSEEILKSRVRQVIHTV
ncbi:tudor domain-containing protein 7A-like [Lingula anatina]|uniref:Tudor domain-containing protein 7A-like n=1 Tax=Lingula anatina TaxID=7574 RepID=A0A1S3HJV9_LINAN|nr:tudor domain-containing protein 7A-like [Lingula anatina]|eukprot:XP_013385741.1 tudor domain-containing protein 7A-like [Lingula anatina]